MACINMFNSDHQAGGLCGPPPPMSPRISFSNDFSINPPTTTSPAAPPDPNFEFSVGSRPMMAADELFFKGRMLPLRGGAARGGGATTLRDELQCPDGEARTPRGSAIRWRELLGLRRPQCSKKLEKGDGSHEQDGNGVKASEAPSNQSYQPPPSSTTSSADELKLVGAPLLLRPRLSASTFSSAESSVDDVFDTEQTTAAPKTLHPRHASSPDPSCNPHRAIKIASNSVFQERTKHIEIDAHYVRQSL